MPKKLNHISPHGRIAFFDPETTDDMVIEFYEKARSLQSRRAFFHRGSAGIEKEELNVAFLGNAMQGTLSRQETVREVMFFCDRSV